MSPFPPFLHRCRQSSWRASTKPQQRSREAENEQPPACQPTDVEEEEEEHMPNLLIISYSSAFKMFGYISAAASG